MAGRQLSVPADEDLSAVGAEIEILDEKGVRLEQTELYPGMAVSKGGFVPVGGCGIGTGDPYFINSIWATHLIRDRGAAERSTVQRFAEASIFGGGRKSGWSR